jgi:hypothetical protein
MWFPLCRPRLSGVLLLALCACALLAVVRSATPPEVCIALVLPLISNREIEALRIIDAVHLAAEDVVRTGASLAGSMVHFIDDSRVIDSQGTCSSPMAVPPSHWLNDRRPVRVCVRCAALRCVCSVDPQVTCASPPLSSMSS